MAKLKTEQELKGLQTQLSKLEGEHSSLTTEIQLKQREAQSKKQIIDSLRQKINSFNKDEGIRVSEHAMLRYVERVMGCDMKALEEKIIDGKLKSCIETLGGNGKYPCDGFTAVVKNNTIVSII